MSLKLEKGINLYNIKNYNEAIKFFKNKITAHPKELKSYTYLSSIYILENKPDLAINVINNALKINSSFDLLNLLGDAYKIKNKFEEAIYNYKKSFNKFKNKESLLKLGMIYYELNNINESIEFYKNAIEIDSSYIDALNNLAICYHDIKKYNLAIDIYYKLINLDNSICFFYANLSNSLRCIFEYEKALYHINKALLLDENNPVYYLNNENIMRDLKDNAQAIFFYDKALEINPNFPEALNNKGSILSDLKKYDEAITLFSKSIILDNKNYSAINNLANLYSKLNKYEESLSLYQECLNLKNDDSDIYNNIGVIYYELNKYDESILFYNKSIELDPLNYEAFNHRGNSYKELTFFDKALLDIEKSIHLKNDFVYGYVNKGNLLGEIGDLSGALNCYNKACEIDPTCIEAQFNIGIIQLLLKDFESGLKKYELRRKQKKTTFTELNDIPYLDNIENVHNKKILIIPEQGIGDIIQFSRYIPLLKEKGADIYFFPPKNLIKLFDKFFVEIKIIDNDFYTKNNFDYYCSILSLPYLLNTKFETIPFFEKYFISDLVKTNYWKNIFNNDDFKIAIAWQGSKNKIDLGRSIPLSNFKVFSKFKNIKLISLQKGEEIDRISKNPVDFDIQIIDNFDEGDNAFLDTMAIMECCDLIITSDTSVAHLAGSIGKPVWLALKLIPDWRWFLNEHTSPWYPSMRIFRQKVWGNWTSVFSEMAHALQNEYNLEMIENNIVTDNVPNIPCSWGEIIDKITILELKLKYIEDENKKIFISNELKLLLSVASKILLNDVKVWELKDNLYNINEELWKIEDDIRIKEKKKEFDGEFINLARSVYFKNDKRSLIKNKINHYLNSVIFEIKSYNEYE